MDHRHLDDSSTSFSTSDPLPRSPRPHPPSPHNDVVLVAKPRRRRRNLARINYCELDQTDADQPCSDLLDLPLTPQPEHRTDQDSIGWEHFIRGRLSLFFTPIVVDCYRANKLGRRFSTKTWFTAVIASLFNIHHQAWKEFCSATTRTGSTSNIASP